MGTQLPRKKGTASPPNFRPMSVVAKRLDASTCHSVYEGRLLPMPHCVRRGPSSPPKGTAVPLFRPISIVATVAHLSYCWALDIWTISLQRVKVDKRNSLRRLIATSTRQLMIYHSQNQWLGWRDPLLNFGMSVPSFERVMQRTSTFRRTIRYYARYLREPMATSLRPSISAVFIR